MKRGLILTAILFTALACHGEPRIVFDNPIHDFGRVPQKQVLTHIFTFRNKGTGTLVINRVQATCGCTSTLLSEKNIKAGKSGNIEIKFHSGSYRGRVSRSIFVYSNDPSRDFIRLVIQADVKSK